MWKFSPDRLEYWKGMTNVDGWNSAVHSAELGAALVTVTGPSGLPARVTVKVGCRAGQFVKSG